MSAVLAAVLLIQRLDSCSGRAVPTDASPGSRFLGGILKIGQETEMQVLVPISEESDFEGFKQVVDAPRMLEERRNHHQRS